MRAIALAITIVIAIAMSVTPTSAADRTVQPADEDREFSALFIRVIEIERAWLEYVLSPAAGSVPWIPLVVPTEQPAPPSREEPAEDSPTSVILEDGAPF